MEEEEELFIYLNAKRAHEESKRKQHLSCEAWKSKRGGCENKEPTTRSSCTHVVEHRRSEDKRQ